MRLSDWVSTTSSNYIAMLRLFPLTYPGILRARRTIGERYTTRSHWRNWSLVAVALQLLCLPP